MEKRTAGVKKKAAPKITDLDKEQRQTALLKEKHCDAVALHIVGKLIDCAVEEDVFLQSLKYINQCHYQDIVEERAITKMCGYPICRNMLTNLPNQTYHISAKSNKIYDISDRIHYCSNFCFTAGHYIKDQILTSPLWYREHETIPNFKLLKKPEKILPGEEIDQGIVKIDPESNPNFTSISHFAQDALNDIPDNYEPEDENLNDENEEIKINYAKKASKVTEIIDLPSTSNDNILDVSPISKITKTENKVEKQTLKEEKIPELSSTNENFFYSKMFSPNLADILSENQKYFQTVDKKLNAPKTEDKIKIKGILSKKDKDKAKKNVSFHSDSKLVEVNVDQNRVFKKPVLFKEVGDVNIAHKRMITDDSLINKPVIEHNTICFMQDEIVNDTNVKNAIFEKEKSENNTQNEEKTKISNQTEVFSLNKDNFVNTEYVNIKISDITDIESSIRGVILDEPKSSSNIIPFKKQSSTESLILDGQVEKLNLNEKEINTETFSEEIIEMKASIQQNNLVNNVQATNTVTNLENIVTFDKISDAEKIVTDKLLIEGTAERSKQLDRVVTKEKLVESHEQIKIIYTEDEEEVLTCTLTDKLKLNEEKKANNNQNPLKQVNLKHATQNVEDLLSNNIIHKSKSNHEMSKNNLTETNSLINNPVVEHKTITQKIKTDHFDPKQEIRKLGFKNSSTYAQAKLLANKLKGNKNSNTNLDAVIKKINQKNNPPLTNQVVEKITIKNNGPLNNDSLKESTVKNELLSQKSNSNEKKTRKINLRNSTTFSKAKNVTVKIEENSTKNTVIEAKLKRSQNLSENLLVRLENCAKQWFTIETMIYLYGEEKVKNFVSDKAFKQYLNAKKNTEETQKKKKQYEDICRRLNLMELADKQFDDNVKERKKKPLPDYEQLKEQAEMMDLKVQAFYSGCFEVVEIDSDDEKIEEEEENDTLEEKGAPAVLPLVDNKDYVPLRKKIFLSSLTRSVSKICELLEQPQNIFITDLHELIDTFIFDSKNIVFKTAEWPVVTIFLVKLLGLKNNDYLELLTTQQGQDYVRSVTKSIFNDSLDNFINKVAAMEEYLKEYLKKDVDVV